MTKTSKKVDLLSTAYSTAVGVAVLPVKEAAMDAALARAVDTIASMVKELEAAGWNIEAVAKYPGYHESKGMSEAAKAMAKARYSRFHSITKQDPARGYQSGYNGAPIIVVLSETGVAKFKQNARDYAATQYDMFVLKLTHKIGEHTAAALEGNHVWGESFLTVVKASGRETWKTQQIWNVSKLGLDFPQWPSRKLKVAR